MSRLADVVGAFECHASLDAEGMDPDDSAMRTPPSGAPEEAPRAKTGVVGLDDVLNGGLPANHLFLIQGTPGVGKTTLALQFLLEGARQHECVLYISLSETKEEIRQMAASHNLSVDSIHLHDLSAAEQALHLDEENTLYATADVELRETMRSLLDEVERLRPARVVFDSLSEIRLLAQSAARYRRQLLLLKQYFVGSRTTVLILDDRTSEPGDMQLDSLAHGVLVLEQFASDYGADRRRLRVSKLRGSPFRSGYHDFIIETGGLVVFPRLVAAEHRTDVVAESIPSGIKALDDLLGGGVDRSTSTLLMGPAGAGKSAIATQFASAIAARGEHAAVFLFEERIRTLMTRARHLGIPLDRQIHDGLIALKQIDPAELAPDEFTHAVRKAVDVNGARLVVIDSLNGYYNAMPDARFLTLQMHELLSFLSERGVATVITVAQSGMLGNMRSPIDVSYLSDTIIFLRYFENEGRVRKAISIVKKRSGKHEDTIRELVMTERGLELGPPLTQFRGVLTGVPTVLDSYSLGDGNEKRGQ